MDLGLKDKVAVVTGVSSQIGFGRGVAVTLAKEGCNIVAADMDLEGAKKTSAEVEALGRKVIPVKVDVSNGAEVKEMVEAALAKFGKIDILVNNAGASTPPKPFMEMTEAEWDRDININLKGVLYCSQTVLKHMIPRQSGKIVNISSLGAKTGGAGVSVYAAAKGGIMVFTKSLAAEMAPLGINVNAIAPGPGKTGFAVQTTPELWEKLLSMVPLGRTTTPQDIASMVAFLVSDISSDIVGQTISVDGGMTMY
jgi:NAD(P)-dependent dehydrogenase (short-subunit alcohol dehydrogenase family)